jgi:hypothetical protein
VDEKQLLQGDSDCELRKQSLCAAQADCIAKAQGRCACTGASVVDINITGNSMGADWDGSAGAANSSALAKGVWSAGKGTWEVLWNCQVTAT